MIKKSTTTSPYQLLLISDDTQGGYELFNGLHEDIHITSVDDKKQCERLLLESVWDVIVLDATFLQAAFLDLFKSIPQKNQWSSFFIIGEVSHQALLVDALSRYAVYMLTDRLDKNGFTTLALNAARISHDKRQHAQKIILAIGAHPDDIEIGCGGYLSSLHEQGHSLNFLTLSLGEFGGKKSARKQESLLASELMHAQLFLKDLKDTFISDTAKTIQMIEEIVQQLHPTHVFTHSLHDNHQDHRNTHLASMVACRGVPNISCYQSPSSTVDFRPALFIDISEHINTKINAIRCYKSQSEVRSYLEPSFIYSTAEYWGRHCDYHLTEPFEIIKMRGGYPKAAHLMTTRSK